MKKQFNTILSDLLDSKARYAIKDWSEQLSVSEQAIYNWKKGASVPQPDRLLNIVSTFDHPCEKEELALKSFLDMIQAPIEEVTTEPNKFREAETVSDYMLRPIINRIFLACRKVPFRSRLNAMLYLEVMNSLILEYFEALEDEEINNLDVEIALRIKKHSRIRGHFGFLFPEEDEKNQPVEKTALTEVECKPNSDFASGISTYHYNQNTIGGAGIGLPSFQAMLNYDNLREFLKYGRPLSLRIAVNGLLGNEKKIAATYLRRLNKEQSAHLTNEKTPRSQSGMHWVVFSKCYLEEAGAIIPEEVQPQVISTSYLSYESASQVFPVQIGACHLISSEQNQIRFIDCGEDNKDAHRQHNYLFSNAPTHQIRIDKDSDIHSYNSRSILIVDHSENTMEAER